MGNDNLYLVSGISGFAPQIGRLVSMLNYARHTTLSAVESLTQSELDYLDHPQSNSIGSLLLHIAAAEVGYQVATFYGRQMNEAENHEWGTALTLGEKARQELKGQDLDYYLNQLAQVRTKTLAELSILNDKWLDEQTAYGDKKINNYFKWFYVLTHEINHRGQIRLLSKLAKQSNRGA
jgi:uncharacterized damage-inducible protein DinB